MVNTAQTSGNRQDETTTTRLWAVSPYSRFAMRLSRRRCSESQILFLVPLGAALPPMIVFLFWFLRGSIDESTNTFQSGPFTWAIPVASLWILFGPLLMTLGESGFRSLLDELRRTERDDGWPIDKIEAAVHRVNRMAWKIVAPFVALTLIAYLLTGQWLKDNLEVGARFTPSWLAGLFVLLHIGHVSGWGIWGVAKALTLTRIASSPSNYKSKSRQLGVVLPPWTPFRSDQVPGLEALATFSIKTALIFSAGSVMVPAIALTANQISAVASIPLWIAVFVLLLGSSALFLVPAVWITQLTRWQKTEYVRRVATNFNLSGLIQLDQAEIDALEIEKSELGVNLIDFATRQPSLPENLQIFRRLPLAAFIPILSAAGTVAGFLRS